MHHLRTLEHRLAKVQPATRHRAAQAGTERSQVHVTRRAPRALCVALGKRLPSPTAHRAARCTSLCTAPVEAPGVHDATVGHARYLPPMLRYLSPQVVVQVNGCDTPTLGAVVDVVSAQASPATAKLLPPTLLARSTCMASLVVDYRPAHLTEEPLHNPRLPLHRGAGVRIRTHGGAMLPSYHPYRSGSPHSCSPWRGQRP